MSAPAHTIPRAAPAANGSRLPSLPRRRSWPLLGAGLLVALLGALLFATWGSGIDERRPVLALANSARAGTPLAADDVRVVQVAADQTVELVPAAARASISGRVLSASLPAGTLLTDAHLGPASGLKEDEATIGIVLEAGRSPRSLAAGMRVAVVPARDTPIDDTSELSELSESAVVESAVSAPGGAGVLVDLRLRREEAAAVASAAAARGVALVLLPPQ